MKTYYENGQVRIQASFLNGKPTGIETHFYKNGKKQQEFLHLNRQFSKMINAWDSSGKQVVMNGNGVITGYFGNWKKIKTYRDSLLIVEQDYNEKDKLVFVDSNWYPQRQFERKETHRYSFDNGRIFREIFTPTGNNTTGWYANGNKMQEHSTCYYKGSARECGSYITWYENGQRSEEGNYIHGKKNGTWKYWDESGKLVREEIYNMGDLVK
jgi:antitoxin component YwqK of YwqJK toxin-antitoxin module